MTMMFGSSIPANAPATVKVSAAGRHFAMLTEDGTVLHGVMETAAGGLDRFQYNGVLSGIISFKTPFISV